MNARFMFPITAMMLLASVTARASGPLTLTSSEFTDGGLYPVQFTCEGEGVSPPLRWSGIPDEARSLAVIMDHNPVRKPKPKVKKEHKPEPSGGAAYPPAPPPKPKGREGLHWYWTMYNIPVDISGTSVGKSVGLTGSNGVNHQNKYAPPCSKGPGVKHYTIHLYALSEPLELMLSDAVSEAILRESMRDLILESDSITVRFERTQRVSNEEKH